MASEEHARISQAIRSSLDDTEMMRFACTHRSSGEPGGRNDDALEDPWRCFDDVAALAVAGLPIVPEHLITDAITYQKLRGARMRGRDDSPAVEVNGSLEGLPRG